MKLLLKKILSYLPTPLPVGLTEFNKFADDIIELSGNYADRDSMLFALASMITHLDHKVASKPKSYFVNCLRKAAANQVAGQIFQDIKTKQQEEQLKKQRELAASEAEKAKEADPQP